MKASNTYSFLNTIRDNASSDYQLQVPVATKDTFSKIGEVLKENIKLLDEFTKSIVMKVAYTNIKTLNFTNPLKVFKSNSVQMGQYVEEIYINPAEREKFSVEKDNTKLLKLVTPDTKTIYYGRNREDKFSISISEAQIVRAFSNENAFAEFYNGIIASLYSGDEISEFNTTKQLISSCVDNKSMQMIYCDDNTTNSEFMLLMKNVMSAMSFPNEQFAPYNLINSFTDGEKLANIVSPIQNQAILIRSDIKNNLDINLLAGVFNLNKIELANMIIPVDTFNTSGEYDIMAVILDKSALKLHDNLFTIRNFNNPENLVTNYYLHHHQTIYLSGFSASCAIVEKKTANSDTSRFKILCDVGKTVQSTTTNNNSTDTETE